MDNLFSFPKWFSINKPVQSFKVGFEEVSQTIQKKQGFVINTLSSEKQGCLIHGSLTVDQEIAEINDLLENGDFQTKIIIYGLNHTDETVIKKHTQLCSMGFQQVRVYLGGMFEWLLLQDIYGNEQFPTTNPPPADILSYCLGVRSKMAPSRLLHA